MQTRNNNTLQQHFHRTRRVLSFFHCYVLYFLSSFLLITLSGGFFYEFKAMIMIWWVVGCAITRYTMIYDVSNLHYSQDNKYVMKSGAKKRKT
jgi:hypothetical protein